MSVAPRPSPGPSPAPARSVSNRERVLLLTPGVPTGTVESVLDEASFLFSSFASVQELYDALRDGAGAVVVTDEAVTEDAVRLLTRMLKRRPPWSNLPIIILTERQPQSLPGIGALDLFTSDTGGNLTILERPVHPVTLTTVLRSALRARRRQYQVRDLLHGLEAKNAELDESRNALQVANQTLEQRVAERTQQVRDLALAVTTAEQHERNRIASILHDHLQQIIHSAKMWAELAIDEPSTSAEGLPRLTELLQEALDITRSLTVELNPPILRNEGFRKALHWLAEHVEERHGLSVHMDVGTEFCIENTDLRTLLFQLTREALFNVVKHANVDEADVHARVELTGRPSTPGIVIGPEAEANESAPSRVVVVIVSDKGEGFDLNAAAGEGHGLVTIRERLELVGGRCEIQTAPGEGTRVRLVAPLEPRS